MSRCAPLWSVLVLLLLPGMAWAEDPVFSGPQVGEKLPSFTAKGVFGDLEGKEFDFIEDSTGKPVFLIFVHARTRPAFGLTNTMMRYASSRSNDGLKSSVVFLTDDPTETGKWMNVVQKHFPQGVAYGISTDGQEGPGAYGLNRNVTLTILVGKEGKVTANFALVQPGLQADGPKILKAIVDATGGGEVPSIADLEGSKYRSREEMKRPAATRRQTDPKLETLLRSFINKQATDEEVKQIAAEVEKYVADNEAARRDVARISHTIVSSDKLPNYGNKTAQGILTAWAKKYEADHPKVPAKPEKIKP